MWFVWRRMRKYCDKERVNFVLGSILWSYVTQTLHHGTATETHCIQHLLSLFPYITLHILYSLYFIYTPHINHQALLRNPYIFCLILQWKKRGGTTSSHITIFLHQVFPQENASLSLDKMLIKAHIIILVITNTRKTYALKSIICRASSHTSQGSQNVWMTLSLHTFYQKFLEILDDPHIHKFAFWLLLFSLTSWIPSFPEYFKTKEPPKWIISQNSLLSLENSFLVALCQQKL